MRKYLIVALILSIVIALSSCAGKPVIKTEYKDVFVPVQVECPVPAPRQDVILIEKSEVAPGDYDAITKAILINNSSLKNKVEELETTLDGYRK